MLAFFDPLRNINDLTILARLLIAFVLGALIGLERSSKNRPAGLRTHVLVALGAAMASLTGHYIYLVLGLPTDLTRLGAQVIAGLGFIGAGTIIVTKRRAIKGLTTAAGMWTTGVIGIAVGSGFYEGAIIATVLVLVCETWLYEVSTKIRKEPEYSMVLNYCTKSALENVLRCCKDNTLSITSLQIPGKKKSDKAYTALLDLRGGSFGEDTEPFLGMIRAITGVVDAQMQLRT